MLTLHSCRSWNESMSLVIAERCAAAGRTGSVVGVRPAAWTSSDIVGAAGLSTPVADRAKVWGEFSRLRINHLDEPLEPKPFILVVLSTDGIAIAVLALNHPALHTEGFVGLRCIARDHAFPMSADLHTTVIVPPCTSVNAASFK